MLQKENILIVDDDTGILELIHRHLHSMDYHTFKAVSVKEAVGILRDTEIHLLITDLKMPEVDGFELIQFVSEHYPAIPKLVVTGSPSIQDALSAIKSGVVDYLVKPFTKAELKQAVQKSFSPVSQKTQSPAISASRKYDEIIGKSSQITKVIDTIDRIKDNKATIYISGESGTGKELVARSIHYNGKFSREPFIAVNCGGIPENLLESELFGYVKGAFTGADEDREGFFQAAEGGTIFLDEIGNASFGVQARLLRVLQEKEVIKVGARKSERIDLRVIAATNSDLKEMVAKETFREDLYYRLTVVEIHVPPLRERKQDIPIIADKFLYKYGNEYKGRYITIDPEAKALIQRYDWPGNIRELENVIQRAVIMCDRSIGIQDLPETLKYQIEFPDGGLLPLKEMERNYIKKVLAATNNNQTKAAEILQIDRKTLRSKIREM